MGMTRKIKDQILLLHQEGKTRPEICRILGCNKSLLSYHLSPGQKEKFAAHRVKAVKRQHPYTAKIHRFCTERPEVTTKQKPPTLKIRGILNIKRLKFFGGEMHNFSVQDVIDKFGESPVCYLTGEPIDISKRSTYHFDHLIPKSRGGTNTLDNLGICTKQANMAKGNMTVEEFREFCRKVAAL